MKQFPDGFWLILSTRLYEGLIFALPKQFRQNYAAEMSQVFRDCCRYAYTQKGTLGVVSELTANIFDLLTNAVKERMLTLVNDVRSVLLLLLTSVLAIGAGLLAAYFDSHSDEVQLGALLVFVFSFILAFIRPSSFLLSGFLVGVMMLVFHFITRAEGLGTIYLANGSSPLWALLALIPAFIGSVAGAFARRFFNNIWSDFK